MSDNRSHGGVDSGLRSTFPGLAGLVQGVAFVFGCRCSWDETQPAIMKRALESAMTYHEHVVEFFVVMTSLCPERLTKCNGTAVGGCALFFIRCVKPFVGINAGMARNTDTLELSQPGY